MKAYLILLVLLFCSLTLHNHVSHALSAPGTISTIASSGGVCDGSKALEATMNSPTSATYHNNELYIADTGSHRVRKVLTNGYIVTIAGTGDGMFNGDNKLATQASLNSPKSVAVSSLGEVFIADTGNHRVRKILSNGNIITIAGNGTAGNNGNNLQASDSMLSSPTSLLLFNDVLYIVDSGNNRVCRLFSNGTLIAVETSMDIKPVSVAIDCNLNIYVECTHQVCKIEPNGNTTVIAGTGTGGYNGDNKLATTAQLKSPAGLSIGSNNELYISDTANNRLRMVKDGIITTIVGTGSAPGPSGEVADGFLGTAAKIEGPPGSVSFDQYGNVLFAEKSAHKIRMYNITSGIISTVVGMTGEFDMNTFRMVIKYCGNGIPVKDAKVYGPIGVLADSLGNIYFGDSGYCIRKILPNGKVITIAGTPTVTGYNGDNILATKAKLNFPSTMALNSAGDLFFGESSSYRIRKILANNGTITTIAGTGTYGVSADGLLAVDSKVSAPEGIAFNSLGDLFFADPFNNRIAKISPDGILTTFAGVAGSSGYNGDNILASQAKLKSPKGLFIDSNDDLYFADSENNRIRKIFSNGTIITIAGTGTQSYSGDGSLATEATFYFPNLVQIDPTTKEIYIGDYMNKKIRKILTNGTIVTVLGGGTANYDGALASESSMNYGRFSINHHGDVIVVDGSRIRKINTLRTCNGIIASDKEVCNSVGTCTLPDVCVCPSTHIGKFCEIPICNGIPANNSLVCSGFGECIGADQCKCNLNYTGQSCEITACNGTSYNSPDVCNGGGSCIAPGVCTCNSNHTGQYCEMTACNGIIYTSPDACNGGGSCIAPGVCSCDSTHAGEFCETPACNGISANEPSVCNGGGVCIAPGVCTCNSNHTGQYCENPACNGTIHTSPDVCNGGGVCSAPGVCSCNSNYTGQFCQYPICNGISSTDQQVCNHAGVCSAPGVCNCDSTHAGQFCQYPKCNGISSVDDSVCLGRGSCMSVNKCTCSNGYYGDNCELMDCFGVPSVNPGACSGYGQCIEPNHCKCKDGYAGDKCELFICKEIMSNSSLVCNGHGSCNAPNACACRDSFYGSNCETTTCYGLESSNANVCLKHGSCTGLDKCECSNAWFGKECQLITCFGVISNESNVCNGHGSCDGFDTCTCLNSWTGSDCSEEVPQLNVPEELYVTVNRVPFNVKQYLTCNQCNISQSLQYSAISWKQVTGPIVTYSKLASNNLEISSFSDDTPQKYSFEVSLAYKTVVRKAQVFITTQDPDFNIILYQSSINSSHVTVGVDYSPESVSSFISSSAWTWKCKNSDLITDCDQSISDELNYAASNRLRSFTLKAGSSKSILISLKIKSVVRELPITFPKDQTVPIINLVSVYPQKPSFTTSDKLSIQIMVNVGGKFDGIESKIKREWKLNGENLISPILTSPTDSSKSNLVTMDISRLMEGSKNNLTCNVTNLESNLSSVFTYVINVETNPKDCSCYISPKTGYAFDTQFTVNCSSNCLTTPQTKLQYAFKDYKTGIVIPLESTLKTEYITPLPYTGSSNLVVLVTATDLKTKFEMTLNVAILLPTVNTPIEVKKKKATWDGIYKNTQPSAKKTVYGYISTAIDQMMQVVVLSSARSSRSLTCLSGGVYNSELKMCNCTENFKKSDCSMTKTNWLELVNDKLVTAQLIFDEFNVENQFEIPTENSIAYQATILYHLLEKYDEISREQLEQGIELFKKLIQLTKLYSYLEIQPEVISCLSSTLSLLESGIYSFDGKTSSSQQLILDFVTNLEKVSSRYQQITIPSSIETMFMTLTSQKMFPFELSNSKIGENLELSSDVSKYLTSNVNLRTPLNVKVWKKTIPTITNQTVQTIDNVEISTSLTSIDYSLSLDLDSQIINIPEQDQVLSYLFAVTPKVKNTEISQPVDGKKTKVTTTTSEMVCLSDSSCLSVKVSDNLYSCKCSLVSYVTMGEKTTTKVQYSINISSNSDYDYLAFLVFVPVILILILGIVIGVVLYKKFGGKGKETGKNVELKSV